MAPPDQITVQQPRKRTLLAPMRSMRQLARQWQFAVAEGVRRETAAEYALSVTGYAGQVPAHGHRQHLQAQARQEVPQQQEPKVTRMKRCVCVQHPASRI